jgi:valyl-tRNA synthetase
MLDHVCVQVLLPMAGLFDVDKELGRLNKQRAKLQKDYDGVTSRLSNTKFVEKASQVRDMATQDLNIL